jgi:ABC-type Mn2+/Zn2+ transport system permease subunit
MDWALVWELFRWAILAALLAGMVCPLVGAFLLVRRTGFYGVALPQFAACGVAFGYALLPWWIAHVGLGGLAMEEALASPHSVRNYCLAWGAAFTFGGLLALLVSGRSAALEGGRLAAAFALASAATILFAMAAPTGREFVEQLLRGEILTVDVHEFETLAVAWGLVLSGFALFHRDLLLVSFDPDTARVLGRRVVAWEGLLFLLTGLTVSAGALVVGPVVLFGLLVIPPYAAHGVARSMRALYVLSIAFGLAAAAGGLYVSFRLDWPLGPSVCAAAGATLVPAWVAGRVRG